MTKLSTRDIFALGFMTFALFIGAGNIIFPPIVAQEAGNHVWYAALGFLVTAVGLPVLAIVALSRVEGSIEQLSSPIGKIASLILTVICYLSVGPLFAIPRTATVSYEIGFSAYLGNGTAPLFIYSVIYFILVAAISLYPNKLLDSIGHILAPIKIVALAILCITTIALPVVGTSPAIKNYVASPVSEGLVNGYLTMDTLAALVFGIVIVQAITSRGITDRKLITRYAIIASIMAGIGLTILYLCLFRLGLQSHAFIPNAANGAVILHAYVEHAFGNLGSLFLGTLIFIACMVTAIGLTCACAEYFNKITRIPYKLLVLILVGFSFVISNLGLNKLIEFSIPLLTAAYPPAIVIILLSFLIKFFNRPKVVFMPVTAVATVFGIIEGLRESSLKSQIPDIFQTLPLAQQNLDWLIPALVVLIICTILDKTMKK